MLGINAAEIQPTLMALKEPHYVERKIILYYYYKKPKKPIQKN